MKKATMTAIVDYLTNNLSYADENEKEFLQSTIDELTAELNKGAEKAQANAELYASAHNVVINALASVHVPLAMSELWDAVEKSVPDGMTKGKMQYAVTRMWADEIVKNEGKPNLYSLKA